MKITKFGHCCMLIEVDGIRILTDPGALSSTQNGVMNIDYVLITHEHSDHLHIESLKAVIRNNPKVKIITNKGVGALLEKEGIKFTLVEDGEIYKAENLLIEGFGKTHEKVFSEMPPVANTGYFIANRFFYPGDSFTNPGKKVEVLALPVAGPWMRLQDALDYAIALKPKECFPVHEGVLRAPGSTHSVPQKVLESKGITFTILELDKPYNF